MLLWLGVLACIIANIGWIISAFVVSRGLKEIEVNYPRIFKENELYYIKIEVILKYLCVTLLIGFITLSVFLIPIYSYNFSLLSWYVIPAGVLLYAAGTGLYYFATVVYLRAEIASQFARVKPLFAILLGIFIFNELFTLPDIISFILVCVGVVLFILITIRGKFGYSGFILGISTAICWVFGEFFMNLAYLTTPANDYKPFIFTYQGTLIGLISVVTVYFILFLRNRGSRKERNLGLQLGSGSKWSIYKYFVLHGILSIAIGYTTNHLGIYYLGIAGAAIITSVWPILSLIIGYRLYFSSGDREKYKDKIYWIILIAIILLIGSIFYIF